MRNRLFFLLIVTIAVACTHTPSELRPEKYGAWISDPDNGLTKSRQISGVQIQARFLPAAYQAYREYTNAPQTAYDSILKSYQCGLTFQIDLEADKLDKTYSNLMYYNLSDHNELTERTRVLNFSAAEFIELQFDGQTYVPVLTSFEGYNTLANKISFMVAFVMPAYKCGVFESNATEMRLTFKDPYWDLGTNHFTFGKKAIVNIPKLKL